MLKNKLRYVVFLFVIAILAILYNEYYTGVAVFAFVLLPVLYRIVIGIAARKVSIRLLSESGTAIINDNFRISIQAANSSMIPIGRIFVDLKHNNQRLEGTKFVEDYSLNRKDTAKKMKKGDPQINRYIISLEGHHSQQLYLTAFSKHCGQALFSITGAYAMDWLGLFRVRLRYNDIPVMMVILPALRDINMEYPVMNMNIEGDTDDYSTVKKGDDASQIFDIRPYREGDRLNRVHWKLSAKEDELIIKEYSMPMNWAVEILIDYSDGNPDDYDKLAQDFLSVSHNLLAAGIIHTVVWFDGIERHCRRDKITDEESLYVIMGYMLEYKSDNLDMLDRYRSEMLTDKCRYLYYIGPEQTTSKFEEFTYEFEEIKCVKIV